MKCSDLGDIPLEDENGRLELDGFVGRVGAVIAPVFQRAIDKAIALLNRNGLKALTWLNWFLLGGRLCPQF